jgi:3-deoxy-7-phosphoheptulonate synthase
MRDEEPTVKPHQSTVPIQPDAARRARRAPVPLPPPRLLRHHLPCPPETAARIRRARDAIRDVLHGRDPRRLVAVVGPCSIHDPEQAMEYALRLARLARETRGQLLVVMRTYFEKPRTKVGWKGLINDPDLDGSCDGTRGLERARRLLLDINALGLACGAEVLDPIAAPYLEDLLSWACIGARTSESQIHRELASRLPMPVGFKNRTDGNLKTAQDALVAARRPHSFFGIDDEGAPALHRSPGNPDAHLVLRGGGGVPNYDPEVVAWAATRARQLGLVRPVWVDCSHDNSKRSHLLQGSVCRHVLDQVQGGHRVIGGFMLESFLEAGSQPFAPGVELRRGVSITDACIGWKETEELLRAAARAAAGGVV